MDNAVFSPINRHYRAISAAAVGKILEESLELTGLAKQGYTVKSFSPTGTTAAIAMGVDPHIVQKVERWKSAGAFGVFLFSFCFALFCFVWCVFS